MTTSRRSAQDNRFVSSILPWLIAAVAMVVYLLTLNRWVSLSNLGPVAQSSGWTWLPEFFNPVFYLVTYPLHWVPARWVPLGYNVFSAICATLILALLARSVALLPHDRTESQRQREKSRSALLSIRMAWIPPVLAAIVCGLQLTFWENATGGSADLFDLLLMAYVIRCMLEFRIQREDSWLLRAALVCGAGMANNWLMFCLFPGILVALVWLKGMEILDTRFLFRLFLCGVAGLLFYLFLPLVHRMSDRPLFTFWEALRMNMALDKNAFMFLAVKGPVNVRLLVAMMSVLPLLIISIRWASNFGDPSRMGSALTSLIFHVAHGTFLILCIWEAFNPVFSPGYLNSSEPSLRFLGALVPAAYYLGALCLGYFCGYFLLVFSPAPDRMGRTTPWQRWLHQFSTGAILLLLLLVPAGLFYRNISQIRMTNGPSLRQYAAQLVARLPENSVLLSDDTIRLHLAHAHLARQGTAANYFFLDTHALPSPIYHGFQQNLHPNQWPGFIDPKGSNQVTDIKLVSMVADLSRKHPIFYLHPSFGYYFEYFGGQPHGLILEMIPYPTNSLSLPPLTDVQVAANENFWNQYQPTLEYLASFISKPAPVAKASFEDALLDRLHIPFRANDTAVALGSFYSRTLDTWGVRLQREGRLNEARPHFQSAIALNTDNVAAQNNLGINQLLQAGQRPALRILRATEDDLGIYRGWQQALNVTGPFDDPTHCLGLALAFAQKHNFRQAGQEFERVHDLLPENPTAQVWLVGLYTRFRLPQKAIALLPEIRAHPEAIEAAGLSKLDVLQAEAAALFGANKIADAEHLLQETMQKDPGNTNLLGAVAQISATFGRYTNAISAVDRLLELQPDNPTALLSKGLFTIQAGNFSDAIPPLTHALELQTNNYKAQLYRALAYVSNDQLAEGERDYKVLQKVFPNSVEVNSGFGEIAWRRKDTNSAILYYERCLSNAPGNAPTGFIIDRLKSLKAGSN